MAGSPEDGEDLLQEIFLQAYRKLGSFKGDAALGTWIYRLALNHCLDYVRSRRAKMSKLTETLDADTSFEPLAPRETPIARLDLEREIERLPEACTSCRQVVAELREIARVAATLELRDPPVRSWTRLERAIKLDAATERLPQNSRNSRRTFDLRVQRALREMSVMGRL